MIYFLFFIIALPFVLAIYALLSLADLKQLLYEKIIIKRLIDNRFVSTLVIKEFVKFVFSLPKNKKNEFLKNIKENKLKKLIPEISDELLRAKMRLVVENKFTKTDKSDSLYEIMEVLWHLKKNNPLKASEILNKFKDKKLKPQTAALKKMLIARFAVCEGDMQTAEAELSSAIKDFQKYRMTAETAGGYFILGNMYRAVGVFDTADFMYRAADEILQNLSSSSFRAEVLGNRSLLMSVQERFDEAQDCLDKALMIAANKPIEGFIKSQQSMLYLLQNNDKKAENTAKQMLSDPKLKPEVEALVRDTLSRLYAKKQKFKQSVSHSLAAAKLFEKLKNYSACYDAYCFSAENFINLNDFEKSEKILRMVIAKEKKQQTCFHVASAYTLLGLILLKQNKPKHAKAIFNQALKQELYNDRHIGIAIDYANLSLVEKMLGKKTIAKKNMEAALSYSKDVSPEVYNQILNGLKDI